MAAPLPAVRDDWTGALPFGRVVVDGQVALGVVNLESGEVVALGDASDRDLVSAAFLCDEAGRELAAIRGDITAAVRERMDRGGLWTMHVTAANGMQITASAPSPEPVEEVDAEALWKRLSALCRKGLITTDARNRAVSRETSFKASKRGMDALRKVSPQVAAVIDSCCTRVNRETRRVSIKQGGSK